MKLYQTDNPRAGKRPKIQLSIFNMLRNSGPKLVETVGVQPTCRYCGRKFQAPQGLACHIQMHERHGDHLMLRKPSERAIDSSSPLPASRVEEPVKGFKEEVKVPVLVDNVVDNQEPRRRDQRSMTRRFNLGEKLRIIEKYKETEN